MLNEFTTIEREVSTEVVSKKSRFIAQIFRVDSEIEAKAKFDALKKQYRDARHNVFAYRLSNGVEKFSDDGEPSGTAGIPILDILRGEKLYNVLLVVTRYFGGVLLGTGGLVRAYSDATKETIKICDKCNVFLSSIYEITAPYSYYDIIQHYCRLNDYQISDVKFSDNVVIDIVVKELVKERFLQDITDLIDRKGSIVVVKSNFYV